MKKGHYLSCVLLGYKNHKSIDIGINIEKTKSSWYRIKSKSSDIALH